MALDSCVAGTMVVLRICGVKGSEPPKVGSDDEDNSPESSLRKYNRQVNDTMESIQGFSINPQSKPHSSREEIDTQTNSQILIKSENRKTENTENTENTDLQENVITTHVGTTPSDENKIGSSNAGAIRKQGPSVGFESSANGWEDLTGEIEAPRPSVKIAKPIGSPPRKPKEMISENTLDAVPGNADGSSDIAYHSNEGVSNVGSANDVEKFLNGVRGTPRAEPVLSQSGNRSPGVQSPFLLGRNGPLWPQTGANISLKAINSTFAPRLAKDSSGGVNLIPNRSSDGNETTAKAYVDDSISKIQNTAKRFSASIGKIGSNATLGGTEDTILNSVSLDHNSRLSAIRGQSAAIKEGGGVASVAFGGKDSNGTRRNQNLGAEDLLAPLSPVVPPIGDGILSPPPMGNFLSHFVPKVGLFLPASTKEEQKNSTNGTNGTGTNGKNGNSPNEIRNGTILDLANANDTNSMTSKATSVEANNSRLTQNNSSPSGKSV